MRYMLLTVPTSILPVAREIARVLDSDTGGDKNFDCIEATDADGVVYAVAHALVSNLMPDYLAGFLSATGTMMQLSVAQQYAARFPDLPVPTVKDCDAFIANCLMVADCGLDDGLASLGMTRIIPVGVI